MRRDLRQFMDWMRSKRSIEIIDTGQCLEAVILGVMFIITMSIFRMPYAVMIGVLIAFTALIPIVGAFIGCCFLSHSCLQFICCFAMACVNGKDRFKYSAGD